MAQDITDYSIDLETTGNMFDAGILSIGAVAFSRRTGKIGPEFYASIKLEEALRYGRLSADTLRWWLKQGKDASKVFNDHKAMPLYDALRGLNDHLRAGPAGACVWGNGSSFDITILEHAFHAVAVPGFVPNWASAFWSIRDLRTLVDVADLDKNAMKFTGTAHNALDDARHQAKVAIAAFAKLRGQPVPASPAPVEEEEW